MVDFRSFFHSSCPRDSDLADLALRFSFELHLDSALVQREKITLLHYVGVADNKSLRPGDEAIKKHSERFGKD